MGEQGDSVSDIEKWALGVISILFCSAVIALWKLVAGKANKPDLAKAIESLDSDIKDVNIRIDQSIVSFASAVSKTDLIKDLGTAATRADDKDLRVQRDIAELKGDLKTLSETVRLVDKKLDELPTRVASLEQTRNQNQR
jgi:predicted  nucleic acid-binding Zn-ribbon protein